jgi:hypothetical protein
LISDSRATPTEGVAGECSDTHGRVVVAAGVEQKRCNAQCSIEVANVKTKRYRANTGIPTTLCIAEERIVPKGCVAGTSGKAKERKAAFSCGEPRVAPIRRWDQGLRLWQNPQAGDNASDEK